MGFIDYMDNYEIIQKNSIFSNPYFEGISILVFLVSLYVLSVFMEKREPIKLKMFSIIHNFLCSSIALATLLGLLYGVTRIGKHSPPQTPENLDLCAPRGFRLKGALYFWVFVFHIQKYYELIDTYLIVLRKSQKGLSFLHVFHHAVMLMLTNSVFIADYGGIWLCASLNSLVHVVMYFYYGLVVLKIKWSKNYYITYMQIIQFLIILGYYLYFMTVRLFFKKNCAGNLVMLLPFHFVVAMFLYMFIKVAINLRKNQRAASQKKVEGAPTIKTTRAIETGKDL